MSFDALKHFEIPRKETWPMSSSQPASSGSNKVGPSSNKDERLPRLKGSTEGIQIGPERDIFQKSSAQTSSVEKPSRVSANPAAEKPGASSWVQSIKKMLSKGNSLKVEKPSGVSATAIPDSSKKLSGSGEVRSSNAGNSAFADTLVGTAQKPSHNLFSAAKVNAPKKLEQSGLTSMLLSAAGLGSLGALVVGPAALVAKPGLVNSVTSTLPTQLP